MVSRATTEIIRTETLPEGALFVSQDNVLYQVVMAGSAGFRKAEPWPWPPHSWVGKAERPRAVALVPGSLLARNYPVVAEGKPLPAISRPDLLNEDGQPTHFLFPTEELAKLAAQLDEALMPQSGLAAWKERRRWMLSDGRQAFRVYHYQVTNLGDPIDLKARFTEEDIEAVWCEEGPNYWTYIPGWQEILETIEADQQPSLESAIEAVMAEVAEVVPKSPDQPVPVDAPPDRETSSAQEGTDTPDTAPPASPPGQLDEQSAEESTAQPELELSGERVEEREQEKEMSESLVTVQAKRSEEREEPPAAQAKASKKPTTAEPRTPKKTSRKKRRAPTMIIAVDIGYGYTKGVGPDGLRFSFPSVIGTAEEIHFATDLISGGEAKAVSYNGYDFFYGGQALLQSRMRSTIFDRSRVHDQTYKMLFVAALLEMNLLTPDNQNLRVVTGLPVEFFSDRPEVIESFEGPYRIKAHSTVDLTVESVVVTPQPFGSLFRELLNEKGKISNTEVEKGRVGVIDIGTFTTDFVVADELRYVQRLSGSIRIGWSKVLTKVQQALGDEHRLELTPHEVDRALQLGEVRVRGEAFPLEDYIQPAVAEVEAAVVARARDLWGEGVNLDTVLVSGGGAPYLFDTLSEIYPHAQLLEDAFWANAEGFYRFGLRPATFKVEG